MLVEDITKLWTFIDSGLDEYAEYAQKLIALHDDINLSEEFEVALNNELYEVLNNYIANTKIVTRTITPDTYEYKEVVWVNDGE